MNDNFSSEIMEIIHSDDRPVVIANQRLFARTLMILSKKMPLVPTAFLHEQSVQQFWETQISKTLEEILKLDAVVPCLLGEYHYVVTTVGNYLYSEKYNTLTPTLARYEELITNYGEIRLSSSVRLRPMSEIVPASVKLCVAINKPFYGESHDRQCH